MTDLTRENVEARHRKELKALEGEKRAALKKAKATKGKKAKDEVVALEADFDKKLREIKDRHDAELRELTTEEGATATADDTATALSESIRPSDIELVDNELANGGGQPESKDDNHDELERQRRIEKARKKKEKAREKERERERQIAEELANAGPSARDLENEIILNQLRPLNLRIREVPADGHCLYRAVAAHYDGAEYGEMRTKCAAVLEAHEHDFSPFCELSESVPDYGTYVDRVRSSADWGGHLELRALSIALQRPVVVYSATSPEPLRIEEQQHHVECGDGGASSSCSDDNDDPIRLSYHRSYYALGEHYNQVVPVSAAAD